MKILFVANRFPYPPYRGDKLKIYNLAKNISQNNEIHLITFLENKKDYEYLNELNNIFTTIEIIELPKWRSFLNVILSVFNFLPFQVAYFKSKIMQNKISNLLDNNKFDAIHVQHLRMSPFLEKYPQVYRILDLPDAFSLYWKRRFLSQNNWIKKYFELWEYKKVYQYERNILKKFDKCLVCSLEDLKYLKKEHKLSNIELLPNGVDTKTFIFENNDYSQNQTILFTGNMDYAPNIDAVVYFTNEIFPTILNSIPNVKFIIAGQRPVQKVLELKRNKNIDVTGFIEKLSEVYKDAAVVVSPLRIGAGTQNKVLEAMSMGVPVVCTNIGFNGLGINQGEGCFSETDEKEFANKVIELLKNKELRKTTGEKGKEIINKKFSWEIISKQLEKYLDNNEN